MLTAGPVTCAAVVARSIFSRKVQIELCRSSTGLHTCSNEGMIVTAGGRCPPKVGWRAGAEMAALFYQNLFAAKFSALFYM